MKWLLLVAVAVVVLADAKLMRSLSRLLMLKWLLLIVVVVVGMLVDVMLIVFVDTPLFKKGIKQDQNKSMDTFQLRS